MIKRIFLILLTLSISLLGADTAYAWGYGDLMIETLKVVKYIFGINEFNDVWKLAMIISLTATTMSMMTPQTDFFKLPKVIFLSTGIWTIFTVNTIDVYVDDKSDNTKSGLVTEVPWAVGYPLSLFTTLEYRLGDMYETATSIPNGMKYSDSGFFTPVSIFSQATQHKIVSPNLYQNLNNYIQDCVMPDLENGFKDYITLSQSDNVWSYMGNTSPATIVMFVNSDNSTTMKTCPNVYTELNTELLNYVGLTGEGMGYIGKSLGLVSSSSISNMLGVANQYLVNSSKSASQMLLQNTALNTFQDSFRNYTLANGGDINSTAFHSASAENQAQAQMIISGLLGSKYIPLIKGILTIVVIGLTPLMALMMITPIGFKTVIGYMMMLFWLSCWHFGDAILNHIILTKASAAMTFYGDSKMSTKGLIDNAAIDYINMASSMYWAVPTIALVVASGFSLAALTSLNNTLTTGLNRTATTTGGELGKGNASFGTVSHDSYNANKTNSTNSNAFGNQMSFNNDAFDYNSSNVSKSGNYTSAFNNSMEGNFNHSTSFGNDRGLSQIMSGMGQSTSANQISGKMNQVGTTATGQSIMDVSGTTMNNDKTGETINAASPNSKMVQHGNNLTPYDGTFDIHTKDMSGRPMVISKEFNNGKEVKTTGKDSVGNIISTSTDQNGNKVFTMTSAEDNKSLVSGIYNPNTNSVKITSGTVDGVDLSSSSKGSTTYSSATANKFAESMGEAWQNTMSRTEGSDISKSTSQSFKTGVDGKVQLNTADQAVGWFGAKATGISANAGIGASISYDNQGNASYKTSDGKTQNIALSGDARKMFESTLQSSMSQEDSLTASRNMIASKLENSINKDLSNGKTLADSFMHTVRHKDDFANGNSVDTNNGVKGAVENGANYSGISSTSNKSIENSDNYTPEWKKSDNKIKMNAIELNNDGEILRNEEESGYNRKNHTIVDQDAFNKQYEKSKNEGIGNYALNSLGQKFQDAGNGLGDLGTVIKEKASGIAPGIENVAKDVTRFDEIKDMKGSDIIQKYNDNDTATNISPVIQKTKSDGDFNINDIYNSKTFDIIDTKNKNLNNQKIEEIKEK